MLVLIFLISVCEASYHEQYRVPHALTRLWESYVYNNKEYLIQNLPTSWENAKILCGGQHNGTLAILDSKEKAVFLAEAMSESQFAIDSLWVGARRSSAEDPAGYRWSQKVSLRRTAADVLTSEIDGDVSKHYPLWLNRTQVPVPEGGADCVALERVQHDKPVFLDLPCSIDRPFVCEREAHESVEVVEVKTVRCKSDLYRIYRGRLDWEQAAAYCLLSNMTLANIASLKCLKKLGVAMLKTRPSIETAWVGARGSLGKWTWLNTGVSIFTIPGDSDEPEQWPPMRDRSNIKQSGCLELDRHASHPPVFMEARCDRKMQFICSQETALRTGTISAPPSDDLYYYVLVKQLLYWQHAYENCLQMNGTLATIENNEMLIQLLLVMGENKDEPIKHIWLSGRLNMSRDVVTDTVAYGWYNPLNGKRIPDRRTFSDAATNIYMPSWLDEEFTMDNPCLNLDRQDHLNGMVYGLPCDTTQHSVCLIEKTSKSMVQDTIPTEDSYQST